MTLPLASAAPTQALLVWTDGQRLFVQLPGPYITTFSLTEGGLSKALDLIKVRRVDYAGVPASIVSAERKPGSVSQHALAQSLLRRKRII